MLGRHGASALPAPACYVLQCPSPGGWPAHPRPCPSNACVLVCLVCVGGCERVCLCVWCACVCLGVCVSVWVCCVVCMHVCVCWESKPFYHPPHTVRSVRDLNRQCDIFLPTAHGRCDYNTRVVVVVVGETDAVPPLPACTTHTDNTTCGVGRHKLADNPTRPGHKRVRLSTHVRVPARSTTTNCLADNPVALAPSRPEPPTHQQHTGEAHKHAQSKQEGGCVS